MANKIRLLCFKVVGFHQGGNTSSGKFPSPQGIQTESYFYTRRDKILNFLNLLIQKLPCWNAAWSR